MKEFKTLKRWHLFVVGAMFVVAAVLYVRADNWPTARVVMKDTTITVLVANTYARQFQGLSNRDSLGEYDGMLFPFGYSGYPTMVMRDMRFSIDMVWLNGGKVVHIVKQAEPEPGRVEAGLTRYAPPEPANAVLELPAGFTDKIGLEIGDSLVVIE